jgi:hypothetical protein
LRGDISWGLCNDPICRKYGTEEGTSVHILCECEALASLRHAYLGSFFLNLEDIRELGMGTVWNFAKGTAPIGYYRIWGTEGLSLRPRYIEPKGARTQYYSIQFYSG